MTIRASTGLEALGEPGRMSTVFFNAASRGDALRLLDDRYLFNVATYAPEIDTKYIYTYAYQPDESWTRYRGDLTGESYRRGEYLFSGPCYFRVCLKRADGGGLTDAEAARIGSVLEFRPAVGPRPCGPPEKPFIALESERAARRVRERAAGDSLAFALLSDSHIVVNGCWDDTLASLRALHGMVGFDGIIHLGDITDGMVTAEATRRYAGEAVSGLLSLGAPLYITIGNHDANYFAGNPEPFSVDEQCALYLAHSDGYTSREPGCPWYYRDFPEHGLRFVFLHSFDPGEAVRYGFSDGCLRWLRDTLGSMPRGFRAMAFSHLTPLVELQCWTDRIRGGDELAAILEGCAARPGGGLAAFVNGHSHVDQVYSGLSFPIVSIGCSKPECFSEHKPAGSFTPPRRLGEASQELWDVMLVTPSAGRIDFVRYGAGFDRSLRL
jgi:hypothetical protein